MGRYRTNTKIKGRSRTIKVRGRFPPRRLMPFLAACVIVLRFFLSPPYAAGVKELLSGMIPNEFFHSVLSAQPFLDASGGTGRQDESITLWSAAIRSQSPVLAGEKHELTSLDGGGGAGNDDRDDSTVSAGLSETLNDKNDGADERQDGFQSITGPDLDPEIRNITVIPASPDGYEYADGVYIKNGTGKSVDVAAMLEDTPLPGFSTGNTILIVHTHASEAYYPDGEDIYEPTDTERTEDENYNVIRVGDEMADILTSRGYNVIHIREIFDYPSYNGSYTRTLEAIEAAIAENPGICMVLDIHRDAMIAADGSAYRTVTEIDGRNAAQVMLVMGTNEGGLEHDGWRQNLTLASHLQQKAEQNNPTLMRPISLSPSRYNQHATPGSMIVEVGTSGNTLREALYAAQLFTFSLCDLLDGMCG